MPIGPYDAFSSGFLSSLHTLSGLASEKERRRVLRMQAQQAEDQQKAFQALPGDLSSILKAMEPTTKYIGTHSGQEISPEGLVAGGFTPGQAVAEGLFVKKEVPGARSLAELQQRVDPEKLSRVIRFSPNLVTALGMKTPVEQQEELGRQAGLVELQAKIAQSRTLDMGKPENVTAFLSETLPLLEKSKLMSATDAAKLLVTAATTSPEKGGIFLSEILQNANDLMQQGTDQRTAFRQAFATGLKKYPQMGTEKFMAVVDKLFGGMFEPSEGVVVGPGGQLLNKGTGAPMGSPVPHKPQIFGSAEGGYHVYQEPLTNPSTPPVAAPLTQAAPPSPTTGSLLAPGQLGFGVAPLAVPSETPPPVPLRPVQSGAETPLTQQASTTGVPGLRTLIPRPSREELIKDAEDIAAAKERGKQAGIPPEHRQVEDELKQATAAWRLAMADVRSGKGQRTQKQILDDIKSFQIIADKLSRQFGEGIEAKQQTTDSILRDLYNEYRAAGGAGATPPRLGRREQQPTASPSEPSTDVNAGTPLGRVRQKFGL